MSLDAAIVVEAYEYARSTVPDQPSWTGFAHLSPEPAAGEAAFGGPDPDSDESRSLKKRQEEEELQRRFEAGRQRGFEEGRKAELEAQVARSSGQEGRHKQQMAALVQKFDAVQERYFKEVEREVVELALAIAARVLRRESQMDPLLLTGAVRVALGELSKTSQVRLHVPPSELGMWAEAITHVPNLALRPEVVAGKELQLGDCLIETELGSVDLGIRAQLAEIERGFFDRLGPDRITAEHRRKNAALDAVEGAE